MESDTGVLLALLLEKDPLSNMARVAANAGNLFWLPTESLSAFASLSDGVR